MPSLGGATEWLNSEPLRPAELRPPRPAPSRQRPAGGARPGPGVDGCRYPLGVRERASELPPRADVELHEHLTQVPFDRARAEEQLGADLRIRMPVARESGDLCLL